MRLNESSKHPRAKKPPMLVRYDCEKSNSSTRADRPLQMAAAASLLKISFAKFGMSGSDQKNGFFRQRYSS